MLCYKNLFRRYLCESMAEFNLRVLLATWRHAHIENSQKSKSSASFFFLSFQKCLSLKTTERKTTLYENLVGIVMGREINYCKQWIIHIRISLLSINWVNNFLLSVIFKSAMKAILTKKSLSPVCLEIPTVAGISSKIHVQMIPLRMYSLPRRTNIGKSNNSLTYLKLQNGSHLGVSWVLKIKDKQSQLLRVWP